MHTPTFGLRFETLWEKKIKIKIKNNADEKQEKI
jgi:hypothetical protein